MFKVEAKATYL